tara:strand:+ start:558 stop:812 length:255 start_codon:yes stop_codon:yes gene_type:complete
MTIAKAIKKINPNAEFKYSEEDIDTIEWLNGTTPISKSDIEAKIAEMPTKEEEEITKENKKASGKQKLKDLGLDDDEIKALIGA